MIIIFVVFSLFEKKCQITVIDCRNCAYIILNHQLMSCFIPFDVMEFRPQYHSNQLFILCSIEVKLALLIIKKPLHLAVIVEQHSLLDITYNA